MFYFAFHRIWLFQQGTYYCYDYHKIIINWQFYTHIYIDVFRMIKTDSHTHTFYVLSWKREKSKLNLFAKLYCLRNNIVPMWIHGTSLLFCSSGFWLVSFGGFGGGRIYTPVMKYSALEFSISFTYWLTIHEKW